MCCITDSRDFKTCEKVSGGGLIYKLCLSKTLGSMFPGFTEPNSVVKLVSQFEGGK